MLCASRNQASVFSVVLFALAFALLWAPAGASYAPASGSAPTLATSYLDISASRVVQPCAGIVISGIVRNASNVSQMMPSVNITVLYNATHNTTIIPGSNETFSQNLTAPCEISPTRAVYNLTAYDNTTEVHNKTLQFYVSNATNVTVITLTQKPPFARNVNSTVNISYFNGSAALSNNIPLVQVYTANGQQSSDIVLYNLTNATAANGMIQYNLSVGSAASGTYALVVDYGLNTFIFGVQAAYALSFFPQTTDGETRGSFAPGTAINLVAKSRFSNSTPYILNGSDYITAYVNLPNNTVDAINLSVTNATTNPGANNVTYRGATLAGDYQVRVVGNIQGNEYETFGMFSAKTGSAKLEAGDDFFKHGARESVILPSQTTTFKVYLYNNTDQTMIQGAQNGGDNKLNCSAIVFNGFTSMATGLNVSWTGTASASTVQFSPTENICAINVGVPASVGEYRLNATLVDPLNASRRIEAEGFVGVKLYGLNLHICPAVSDFMSCGFAPFFERNGNASFSFAIENFTSGLELSRANILNITGISVRKFSFNGGNMTLYDNWTANSTYFLRYPTVFSDSKAVRLVLNLSVLGNTSGPHEIELVINSTVGPLKGRDFFMVKATAIEAHGGPFSGNNQFSPQSSCNGTQTFFMEAFDMKTQNAVRGVAINGVLDAIHAITGKVMTSEDLTNITTNTTGTDGRATFNVTFNSSRSFLSGPYGMRLNISYQGTDDEAFAGFFCGSGSFAMFGPAGGGGPGEPGMGGPGPQGPNQMPDSGVRIDPDGPMLRVSSSQTAFLSFRNAQFGGQGYTGGGQQGGACQPGDPMCGGGGPGGMPQAEGINGTLRIPSIRVFNPMVGAEKIYSASDTLRFNVTSGMVSVTLLPANFSLSAWPQGFIELTVNLTNGTAPGLENANRSASGRAGGFESSPYRVYVDQSNVPSSMAVGENVSIVINASTNVSTNGNNVTVRLRSATGMGQQQATLLSAVLLIDGWNTSANDMGYPPGAESWNVTFVVPQMPSGPVDIVFIVNNSAGLNNELGMFSRISSFSIKPAIVQNMRLSAGCTVMDDANQNGSLQNCAVNNFMTEQGEMGGPGMFFPPSNYQPSVGMNATRMNFTILNWTYSVSSKSGYVCYKEALNWSNFFNFDPNNQLGGSTSLDNGTVVAVIDNTTAGVYDTIVFNRSEANSNVTIMSMSNTTSLNRNLLRVKNTFDGLYVPFIFGCPEIGIVNGTSSRTDTFDFVHLGRYPRNQKWYVPYKVTRGSAAVSNASVDLMGFGNMTMGFGGFESMLDSSRYNVVSGVSDSNGMAFIEANVTSAGEFIAFWKVNATIGGVFTEAYAKMQKDKFEFGGGGGNQVEIAAFESYCMGLNPRQLTSNSTLVTINCTAGDFNGSALQNANLTLFYRDFNRFPPVQETLALYNTTTGAQISGGLTDAQGQVSVSFNRTGGWVQGRFYDIGGTMTHNNVPQNIFAGGVEYFGGATGGFQGGWAQPGAGGP